ncbi:UvrD-helicase domain-containing protein ['Elaeagnus angustifolia' witches'-broom phytoplasma]|uniref:DNA 3'-5' helicase n=1 Tax='Elaeagnus angustifolia' witches'-broom phytoplasma TaxID=1538355 RepID=A0ABS5V9C1_9MOLU|nr:UvrD-helicase domain-containing protein ['Elaeagnus angustifolia' witches'-broom phytoplasma]
MLFNLSKEQKDIINSDASCMYIHGGAGSGKTTILIEKLRQKEKEKPLILVATNATKNIIYDKLFSSLKEDYSFYNDDELEKYLKDNYEIRTFHSFAYSCYLKYNIFNETAKQRKFIDDETKLNILKLILKENQDLKLYFKEQRKYSFRKLLQELNNLIRLTFQKENCYSSIKIDDKVLKKSFELLLNLYYEKLNYYNLITFDGLLIETSDFIEFVDKNNGLIYNRPVFIDEFQDLNYFYYFIIKELLFNKPNSLYCFGDYTQNIYSFFGSSERILELFVKDFKPQKHFLNVNYRSKGINIVKAANELIDNKEYLQLSFSEKKYRDFINFSFFDNFYQQINYLCEKIKNSLIYSTTVLCRSNGELQKLKDEFEKNQIPFTISDNNSKENEIVLSTIHGYKGYENEYVYLIGWQNRNESQDKVLEKKIIYTAITRAKRDIEILTLNDSSIFIDYFYSLIKKELISDDFTKGLNDKIFDLDYLKICLPNSKDIKNYDELSTTIKIYNEKVNQLEKQHKFNQITESYYKKCYLKLCVLFKEISKNIYKVKKNNGYETRLKGFNYFMFEPLERIKCYKKHLKEKKEERYLSLSDDDFKFDYSLKKQLKENKLEEIKPKSKILRHYRDSSQNAKDKLLYNFKDSKKISFITLTAPYDDLKGKTIKYTHEPDIMGQVRKRFIRLVRKNYLSNLFQQCSQKDLVYSKMQDFRYFWSLETTKLGVIHYHIIFNIDVLNSFGVYSRYLCTDKDYALGLKNRPIKGNKSIFYDDYLMHKIDEKGNIKIPQNYYEKKNVKVSKITLLWANAYASVMNQNNIKHYKHLNPISQNVQIFRPSKTNLLFEKIEISKCKVFYKGTFNKKDYVNKIVSYVSKYVSKNDKQIESNSNKGIDFYSRHLFGFSRTCLSCPQESFLALFPYDIIKEIELSSFPIVNFNFSNIFEWNIKQRVNGKNIKIPHNLTLLFKSYMNPNQFQNSNYFSLNLSSIQPKNYFLNKNFKKYFKLQKLKLKLKKDYVKKDIKILNKVECQYWYRYLENNYIQSLQLSP